MEFKYYIELPWIPLYSRDLKSTRTKINVSKIRRPEIVRHCSNHVYEISDPFLFYTDEEGTYEYTVYEFQSVRVAKFRKIDASVFRMCIKAKDLNIKFLELLQDIKDRPSLSAINKYNTNIFYEIEKPIFIGYEYNYVVDIIGYADGGIYLSIGNTNHFILLGKSIINFRAKAQANFINLLTMNPTIQLMIFDVYQIDSVIIRENWETRVSHIPNIIIQFGPNEVPIEIKLYTLLENRSERSIIIDNDKVQYMEYNKIMSVICQSNLNESQIKFRDGFIEVDEKTFASYDCSNNETIVCTAERQPSIIEPHACDAMSIDKFSTFKFFSRAENDRQKYNKKSFIKNYAAGKTLVLTKTPLYINDVECDESSSIDLSYHTIVINDDVEWKSEFENLGKKIILFNKDGTWEFKDAGEKTFVFLVGTIGSGKSALVKKVRSLFNMSGGIFVAQIDKLIEPDIEFIINPNSETYWKLRKEIYNQLMDQLIGQSIMQSNSIILETTHVNNDFIGWLRQYEYKIGVVVVHDTYEKICENIAVRNQTKIRKTALAFEDYQKFTSQIPQFIQLADYVHYLKPER